ncbi:MAG TPA: hypothetical protein VK932_17555 [Kofleriaceae bacterium]|nr:hypothetical protein [Kofleriaceae bacterium]
MRALRTLTLLIALASTSTAHAGAEAGPAPELSATHAEKLLAYYNELVDHAVKHAADCGALASALDGVVNRHLNTIQMTWAAKKAKKVVPKDVQSKLDARQGELVGALRGCWADARVKAVFQRMKPPAEKKS